MNTNRLKSCAYTILIEEQIMECQDCVFYTRKEKSN